MATTMDHSTVSVTRGAGPLTTVFTMPDFCSAPWWTFIGTPAVSSSVCMPSNWVDYYGNRHGFYSPGICPKGYTNGCYLPTSAAQVSNGSPWNGGPILAGETARICCPEGYSCFEDRHTDSAVQWRKCITTAADPLTTFPRTIDGTTTMTTTTPALAFGIQVRWQSSDLSILETNPTVPGTTYSATYTGTPHRPGDSGGSGSSGGGGGGGDNEDGPPTTVIIVGVVVPLVSLILGIIAFLYWRHHYRTKYRQMEDIPSSINVVSSPPTVPAGLGAQTNNNNNNNNNNDSAATSREVVEVGEVGEMGEMDASVVVHEAGGEAHTWIELPGKVHIHEMPVPPVHELADTSIPPPPGQAEVAQATANDVKGSTAHRKSVRGSIPKSS